MLRVECESCKSPYQVDERRVPAQGLKMRCPKCGTTFMVRSGIAPTEAAKPADATAPQVAARKPNATMMGLGIPGLDEPPPSSRASVPPALPGAGALPRTPEGTLQRHAPAVIRKTLPPGALNAITAASRVAAPPLAKAPPLPAKEAAVAPEIPDFSFGDSMLDDPFGGAPAAELPAPARGDATKPVPAAHPRQSTSPRDDRSSGLPAALGSLDDDLPLARRATPLANAFPTGAPGPLDELDLPSPAADFPAMRSASPFAATPPRGSAVPAAARRPPSVRPDVADGFGDIDFPMAAGDRPTATADYPTPANMLPSRAGGFAPAAAPADLSDFGELDLPPSSRMPIAPGAISDFGELDPIGAALPSPMRSGAESRGGGPNVAPPPVPARPQLPPPAPERAEARQAGGMAFGEVDLGGSDEPIRRSGPPGPLPRASTPPPRMQSVPPPSANAGAELTLPAAEAPRARRDGAQAPRKKSGAGRVVLAFLAIAAVGGGALELSRFGAFGRFVVIDKLHATDYATATAAASKALRDKARADTFASTRGAVDEIFAAHARTPRAKALTAYAAFAEFAYEARFGADPDRSTRAKQLLAELERYPDTSYLALATAAQGAIGASPESARAGLEAAARRAAGDPVGEELALLRGDVELKARNAPAARAAFAQALSASGSARVHFGAARAAKLADDDTAATKEIDAALVASPLHAGALTLRGSYKYSNGDELGALADFNAVCEGPAKAGASPNEIADARAHAAFIHMKRGRAADARAAFDMALKTVPTHVTALVGQGMMLSSEGRYSEALSRFDTALQSDPNDTQAIAYDALTKVHLERLKDAKDQLIAARTRFPKSMLLSYALADAERALGNREDADKALRSAIELASPRDPDAVMPYVALATLLASQDKNAAAKAVVEEASTKLPDTPALERALAEFLAAQGDYEAAVKRYARAVELDPQDLLTRFKLGVTYRRMRRMTEAAAQFDQVRATDKDSPGLSLERGLLFEESGNTEKALDEFKAALAKAPEDPDLMLRVGAAYVAIGRGTEGLPMLRKVLEKRANSAEANHYLGRALFAQNGGGNAEAMRYLRRATELDSNRAEYHMYVAWAANESNNREALGIARDEIERAYALDKLNGDVFWQRGSLERKQGAVEDAERDLKRALQLKPSRIEAHAALAECYEDKNDVAAALDEWQKAVSGNDSVTSWRYRFGKLLLERGNAAEAAKHLGYAAQQADKMDIRPGWFSDLQFQTAEAFKRTGQRKEAIERFKKFLEVAPTSSPDRRDAVRALGELGAP